MAKNVRRIRERAGLSQEELAHTARVHTTYLSGVENGRRNPTIDVVERLAEGLKVEPADLLKRDADAAT